MHKWGLSFKGVGSGIRWGVARFTQPNLKKKIIEPRETELGYSSGFQRKNRREKLSLKKKEVSDLKRGKSETNKS